jgi:SAM-dependent methyltransferase
MIATCSDPSQAAEHVSPHASPASRSAVLTCPCCGGSYERFNPFGVRPRANARCPGCGALERHRLLWLYFNERTNLCSGQRLSVLHVAPEAIFQAAFRRMPNLHYVSADIESPLAEERIDIMDIPRPDETFDVILCNHVLEHVADDHRAMRELRRVLKTGGWAILQSPMESGLDTTFEDPTVTDPKERERLFGQHDHVRLYGRDYGKRLESAGFDVTIDRFCAELSPDLRRQHALLDEDIYLCRKAAARPVPTLPGLRTAS